ncbi:MAG: hypothetical protein NTZ33_02295 [Bacteroidetes bacterium]|nr:hypothetical protein [Bacteroidota bacterium]
MENKRIIMKLEEIKKESELLVYSEDNIVEILSLYNQAMIEVDNISNKSIKAKCIYELKEMKTDEYADLINSKGENINTKRVNINKFKYEFINILDECIIRLKN